MDAVDRHGNDVKKGDTVEFVHGGDHQEGIVEHLEHGPGDLVHVAVTTKLSVPAGWVTRTARKVEHKPEKKEEPATKSEPEKKSEPSTKSSTTDDKKASK